jgi:YlmC/YmxH family sporulation protein
MRFSQLANKEIINLLTGARLGVVGDSDLVVDPQTGQIEKLILPQRSRLGRPTGITEIAWSAVRRVGPEVLIVELGDSHGQSG